MTNMLSTSNSTPGAAVSAAGCVAASALGCLASVSAGRPLLSLPFVSLHSQAESHLCWECLFDNAPMQCMHVTAKATAGCWSAPLGRVMAPPLRISAVCTMICWSALIMPAVPVPLRFPVPLSPVLAMAASSVMIAAVPPPFIITMISSVVSVPGPWRPLPTPVLPRRCMSVAVALPLSSCAPECRSNSQYRCEHPPSQRYLLDKQCREVCIAGHHSRKHRYTPGCLEPYADVGRIMIRTSVCPAGGRCGQLLGRHEAGLHLLAGRAPRELHVAGVHPAAAAGVGVAALQDAQLPLQSAQAAPGPQPQVARLMQTVGWRLQMAAARSMGTCSAAQRLLACNQVRQVRLGTDVIRAAVPR